MTSLQLDRRNSFHRFSRLVLVTVVNHTDCSCKQIISELDEMLEKVKKQQEDTDNDFKEKMQELEPIRDQAQVL